MGNDLGADSGTGAVSGAVCPVSGAVSGTDSDGEVNPMEADSGTASDAVSGSSDGTPTRGDTAVVKHLSRDSGVDPATDDYDGAGSGANSGTLLPKDVVVASIKQLQRSGRGC